MNDLQSPNKPIGQGPKTRVCYICGRQYSLHSYEIHIPQCKDLWIKRESQKDPKERKPLPEDPMLKYMSVDSNELGSPSTLTSGRSFKSVDGKIGGVDLDEINKLASEAFNTESLSTCAFCGRSFLPEKLVIHNRSCTADTPARKVSDNIRKGAPPPQLSEPSPITPSRPATTSGTRNIRKTVTIQEEAAVDLKISNGALVGHLGGASGRGIRKGNASNSPTPALFGAANGDINFTTKQEGVALLTARIELMESIANELLKSASDMKQMISRLNEVP